MPHPKNSVRIKAFSPNATRFAPRACFSETRHEAILRRTKHATLNEAVDTCNQHFYVRRRNIRRTAWPREEEHGYDLHIDYVEPGPWFIEDVTERVECARPKTDFLLSTKM